MYSSLFSLTHLQITPLTVIQKINTNPFCYHKKIKIPEYLKSIVPFLDVQSAIPPRISGFFQ